MLVNITKKTVIVFIIGILIGAIIATAGFLIFSKCKSGDGRMTPPSFSQSDNGGNALPGINGNSGNGSENSGQMPQMPGGGQSGNQNGGQNQRGNQNGQPPQMPGGNNSNSSEDLPLLPGTANS